MVPQSNSIRHLIQNQCYHHSSTTASLSMPLSVEYHRQTQNDSFHFRARAITPNNARHTQHQCLRPPRKRRNTKSRAATYRQRKRNSDRQKNRRTRNSQDAERREKPTLPACTRTDTRLNGACHSETVLTPNALPWPDRHGLEELQRNQRDRREGPEEGKHSITLS